MKHTRIHSRIIAALLLISSAQLFSCGESVDTVETNSTTQSAGTTSDEGDGLPNVKLDGFELRFLNYDESWFIWAENRLDSESEDGDLINDTI